MATYGIPERITTDGGPPYSGHEFGQYCQRMGVEHHMTTSEDAQANCFVEAFIKIMVKLVHTVIVEKKDHRTSVIKYLLAYRVTPHKVTGRNPAELLFGRKIRTKLPGLRVRQQGEMDMDIEDREKHQREKEKQKLYADERRKAKIKNVKLGDQVMVQPKKSTIKTPWDTNPYSETQVKGSQLELKRGEEVKRKAVNLVKKIKWKKGEERGETKNKDIYLRT